MIRLQNPYTILKLLLRKVIPSFQMISAFFSLSPKFRECNNWFIFISKCPIFRQAYSKEQSRLNIEFHSLKINISIIIQSLIFGVVLVQSIFFVSSNYFSTGGGTIFTHNRLSLNENLPSIEAYLCFGVDWFLTADVVFFCRECASIRTFCVNACFNMQFRISHHSSC